MTLDNASENVDAIFAALAKAQAELGSVSKDAQNPHLKNRYSTLHALVDAIRGPLTKHELCWFHQSVMIEGVHYVRTTLGHSSGQWLSSLVPVELGRGGGPQAMGSGITYARRYGLGSLCGITSADEDDDGERARAASRPPRQAREPRPSSAALRSVTEAIDAAQSVEELQGVRPQGDLTEEERATASLAYRIRKNELEKRVAEAEEEPPETFGFTSRREPGSDDERE